jgi:hypothetical protein
MKKTAKFFLTVIIAALMIAAPMTVFAFAPVGDISVPFGTPKIDGVIDQGEWSAKTIVDQSNATAQGWQGEVPAGLKIDFYYTWDTTNLYLAGAITDPTFFYAASGDNYGSGDAFQISLNLGQVFKSTDASSRAIFYSIGCLEDGTVDVMRQESNDNVLLNDLGFSKKTDTGWQFEVALPWATLVQDAGDKSGATIPAVDAGFKIGGLICYMDHDDAGTLVNCFFTSNAEPGGWDPDVFGITFNLAAKAEVTEAPVTAAPDAAAPATDAPAAQTADTAIFAAALVILAAGAVIVATKKK